MDMDWHIFFKRKFLKGQTICDISRKMIDILFVFTRNATQIPISESYFEQFFQLKKCLVGSFGYSQDSTSMKCVISLYSEGGRDVMNTFSWCEVDVKDGMGLLPLHVFKYS